MKKILLTTLITAAISSAAQANELAKLSYISDAVPVSTVISNNIELASIVAPNETKAVNIGKNDTSQHIFIPGDSLLEFAILTPEEMAETEGALHPVLLALAMINASVWSNHGFSYYHTGQPASLESTALAAATGAIPAGRALYGVKFGGGASAPYTTAHAAVMSGVQLGIGSAASHAEHRPKDVEHRPSHHKKRGLRGFFGKRR